MLISVIIPCYNVEECIHEAVATVVNQTCDQFEVICIDNNSSDNTWQVLQEITRKHQKVKIDKELRPGANAARNKGLQLAKGEWIQFLDADDLLEPDKLQHQVELIQASANEDTAFIVGASKKKFVNGDVQVNNNVCKDPYLAPFINQSGNTCANLWSMKWLLKVNMWMEHIKSSQETDLMLRLVLEGGKCLYDDQPLTIIRQRESGQISQTDPVKRWKQYLDVRLNYLEKLKQLNNKEFERLSSRFYDFLMVTTITLSKYDKEEALIYYNNKIKPHWRSSYAFGMSRFKVLLIKYFGLDFFLTWQRRYSKPGL